jgi:hypothetical protein
MAEPLLDKRRLRNDSVGEDVVVAHNDLEDALSQILGVPLATQINTAVFGSVTASGEVTLIRFKDSVQSGGAAGASGFEFADSSVRKRLVFVGGNIQVWEADDPHDDDTEWTLVYDYETVDEPNLDSLSDVQIPASDADKENDWVLGFQEMPNGDIKVVQMPNAMATDGAQNFKELTDVSQNFQTLYTGSKFDATKIGHLLEVKDTTTIHAVDSGSKLSSYGCFLSFLTNVGRVGINGLGVGWTPVTWRLPVQGSTITSISEYDGQANHGISLAAGIWRATVTYRPITWVKDGFISWKIVGAPEFPPGQWARQHNPYERFDGLMWWDPFREPPDPEFSGGWGQQEQYLVVPETTTVALHVGRESAEAMSAYFTLALMRIL